jgi:ADP-dependent NAD(P)H-hydrate dehydratase / NAD(P)H-hydrate epimerase
MQRAGDPRRREGSAAPPVVLGMADVPLLSAEEMRAWDTRAIERDGVLERALMESAGRALAGVVQREFPSGRVVGACGRGHNGGDALIALRTLRAWGREVALVPVGGSPDASLMHGWELDGIDEDSHAAAFATAGVVLDGLMGTGATGAPREPYAACIRAINGSGAPVVAVDGPSGIDMTSGAAAGDAVRAALTVTFGAPKRGLLRFPGREHAGRIVVVEIGFPPFAADGKGAALITPAWAAARLPAVEPSAHKGDLGEVVVLAGSIGVAGAAALVATGAARAGAGKVHVISTPENRSIVQTLLPEALFVDRGSGAARELLERADAVVVGPGMGTDAEARALLRVALEAGTAPLVLDADALSIMAGDLALRAGPGRGVLLTPHPGEMARLLGCSVPEVTSDPFETASTAAQRFGAAVLLKGAPSVVAAPGAATLVNAAGHSGIATGGMGDTLAGVAAALLAAGADPQGAGALALWLCGRAAEIAGRGRSLLPRDVAEQLAAALQELGSPPRPAAPGVLAEIDVPR